MELTGKYHLLLENFKEAVPIYEKLLKRNQENLLYFEHLISAKQLKQNKDVEKMYLKFKEEYPNSRTLQVIMLNFYHGPLFEKELHGYLKCAVQKGILSCFKELGFIYNNKDKIKILQSTLIKMLSTLKFCNAFDERKKEKEPETSFVWCHYFLSCHLDKVGKYEKALELIDTVIRTNPKVIELLLLKGKILKHRGDLEGAMKILNQAQKLDSSDKCLGCKCGKYMIRAGHIEQGLKMIRQYDIIKDKDNSPCHWLLLELAQAYQKRGDLHYCAEKCIELRKSFEGIWEDQLDFHVFALTKMRLCSYVELLRLEDTVYQNMDYKKVALIAMDVLLKIYDSSPNNKKVQSRAQKNKTNAVTNGQKKKGKARYENKYDDDFICEFQITDPLYEASKFIIPLQEMFSEDLSTYLATYDFYLRKNKPLLMLQSINRLQELDKTDQRVVTKVTDFYNYVSKNKPFLSETVLSVIKEINA